MADRHQETFLRDDGYRLTKNGISVVVGSLSFGRVLTPEQNTTLTEAVSAFLGAVRGLPPLATDHPLEINPDGMPAVSTGPFYKYVPDEIWERYGRHGCFQLGSAQYYKNHENPNIRDELEGSSFFHLIDGIDQLNCAIVSGFNGAIFCGTSAPDHNGDRNMKSFGGKLLKIDLPPFIEAISKRIGAVKTRVHDVVYSDSKNCIVHSKRIHVLRAITNNGNLTKMMLRRINKTFFDDFYEAALIPSLFAKPHSYRHERERRIVLELREDLRWPTIVVEDPVLLQHVEIVT